MKNPFSKCISVSIRNLKKVLKSYQSINFASLIRHSCSSVLGTDEKMYHRNAYCTGSITFYQNPVVKIRDIKSITKMCNISPGIALIWFRSYVPTY